MPPNYDPNPKPTVFFSGLIKLQTFLAVIICDNKITELTMYQTMIQNLTFKLIMTLLMRKDRQ